MVAAVADLMATFFDWTAIFLSWLTLLRLGRRGKYTFDYGYGKLENLGALLDRPLEENAQILIVRELANFFDEYVALHGVRSRRSGNRKAPGRHSPDNCALRCACHVPYTPRHA